jgi:hypothetical protein
LKNEACEIHVKIYGTGSVYQNILISKHSRATGKYIPKNRITVQTDIALRIKKADHPDSAFCNFNMF